MRGDNPPGIGHVLTPLCTVQPHPTVEGAATVHDPRIDPSVRLLFASKERAEIFATRRNLQRERTMK
jgi:hypothetical protein